MARRLAIVASALLLASSAVAGWYSGGGSGSTFDNSVGITAPWFNSSSPDNTLGMVINNSGPVADNILRAHWLSTRDGNVLLRSADNTTTSAVATTTQYFSFVIKNPTVSDNVILALRVPWAIRLKSLTCRASVDNVVGFLSVGAADNVADLTQVFAATTFTNANAGVSVTLDNAVVATGSVKWLTQSVGTATQFLQCGGTYEIR